MSHRFSLRTLFTLTVICGILFAYVERRSRDRLALKWRRSESVSLDDNRTAERILNWLTELGFQPIADPPPFTDDLDHFGNPYKNFFVGSFEGSPDFYVSIDPCWDPIDRPEARHKSILLYLAADFRIRRWQAPREHARLERFWQSLKDRMHGQDVGSRM